MLIKRVLNRNARMSNEFERLSDDWKISDSIKMFITSSNVILDVCSDLNNIKLRVVSKELLRLDNEHVFMVSHQSLRCLL